MNVKVSLVSGRAPQEMVNTEVFIFLYHSYASSVNLIESLGKFVNVETYGYKEYDDKHAFTNLKS